MYSGTYFDCVCMYVYVCVAPFPFRMAELTPYDNVLLDKQRNYLNRTYKQIKLCSAQCTAPRHNTTTTQHIIWIRVYIYNPTKKKRFVVVYMNRKNIMHHAFYSLFHGILRWFRLAHSIMCRRHDIDSQVQSILCIFLYYFVNLNEKRAQINEIYQLISDCFEMD